MFISVYLMNILLLTLLTIDCCDYFFHRRISNGHIKNMAALHNRRDNWFQRAIRCVYLKLQFVSLRFEYLHTVVRFPASGRSNLKAQPSFTTLRISFQQWLHRLIEEQIDGLGFQVVAFECCYRCIENDLAVIDDNSATTYLFNVACVVRREKNSDALFGV